MTRLRWMMAVLLAVTASLTAAKETATAAKVPDDLQKRVSEAQAAFNQQDAKKMSAMFTAKGSFVNPRGERATGRGEIESRFTEDFAGPLKGATSQIRIEKALMVSPTVAFLDLEQEISGPNLPEGMPRPAHAHGVALWQKTQGKWMIAALRPYFFLRAPPARSEGNEPSTQPSGGASEPSREPGSPQQQR